MIRREFLRLAASATVLSPLNKGMALRTAGLGAFLNNSHSAASDTELEQLFLDPPNAYRPMVRWWWNGDRVTAEEVTRELDVLKNAGIGGVEINPIRFPGEADPGATTPLVWMSDEWIAVLEAALRGTKERGMTCDMIVGSGWPYGGEFLSREDQTEMMALGTRELTGPISQEISIADLLADVHPRFVSAYKNPLKEFVSATLVPYELNSVDASIPVPLSPQAGTITVHVPEGRHVLYFLVKLTGFMAVINGAPGASGPVLNHYSAPAVARYLDRISDRLVAKIGPLSDHFRAFFTDSIELEGENWCSDMQEEFQRRRGYDLAPYLPFVLFKVGEMGNAVATPYGAHFSPVFEVQTQSVRYDFETTKRELFQERFIGTFVSWCQKHGVKSRMQAYGMDCDAISSSMMLDIPECETWLRSEKIEPFGTGSYTQGRDYSVVNKLVASGAHLAGKHIVSCEEMTNTDDPFHISLNRLKSAGDQNMLTGVTQSVFHGFNYSPLSAPFPGWVRYGTYFSERNTWWPYFKNWTDYKARLYALLQHAEMQAEIAILPPNGDLAARYGFQRDPFPRVVLPEYLYKLWEVVHQNGDGCDYLSEEIIQKSSVQQNRLNYGSRSYKAVLLAEVESIHPATARQLHAFVASGGTVLFLGKQPHLAPGLMKHAEDSAVVSDVVASMRRDYSERAPLIQVEEQDMVGWYRNLQQRYKLSPTVQISNPTDYVSQIHYRAGSKDIFFFTHYGAQDRLTFQAKFGIGNKRASLWNAENGHRFLLPQPGQGGEFTLSLGPSESQLIVFDSPLHGEQKLSTAASFPPAGTPFHEVSGPWTLKLDAVDGSSRTVSLTELHDLDTRDDLRSFAGTVTYSKQITLTGPRMPNWLNLGAIHAVSRLSVNGKDLGLRWYGDQTYDVAGALKQGTNDIVITVVTTLGSYMKSLKDNATAKAWTEGTPDYPLGLTRVELSDV